MKIIFSGFLWIIISSYIFSQTGNRSYSAKGILTGEVIDENQGIPLEYVTISLLDSNDSILVTGTITNAEGKFQLTGLDFGNYFIDISFVGYRPLRIKNIQISPGNANVSMGKIKFSPAVIAMDGVEVIAEKSQVEYKIDKKVINVGKDLVSAGGSAVEA
ncbi:MAG: carboxypeptidase-like regulatory domain-containing protein, partial [bacterium]